MLLESDLQATGTQWELDLPDSLPELEVDRIQIRQVLLNLCANAIDAMRHCSGEKRIRITARISAADRLQLRIRDWGPGIPSEMHEVLFRPLGCLEPNGLAMGLAISRRIIEAHAGSLQIMDGVRPGVELCCELPIGLPVCRCSQTVQVPSP